MTPALIILLAWCLFAGSHLYMSGSDLRARLAPKVSKNQFTVLFAFVTILTMCILIAAVAVFGDQGWRGPNLGPYPGAGPVLGAIALGGVVLAVAGLLNYPKSPMAVLAASRRDRFLSGNQLKAPSVVERVSRHPFFAGVAIFMAAHVLLATTLAGAVHFGGYVAFALVGIHLQDKKLRNRWQAVYADFEQQTSSVPFVGVGKSTRAITPAEWGIWGAAVLVAALLVGGLHGFWANWNGATFLIFDMVFGSLAVFVALLVGKAKQRR